MQKVIVHTDELKSVLAKVGKVIKKKNVLPVLDYFLIKVSPERTEVIATDLETTLRGRIEADTTGTFDFLLPMEFIKVLGKMSDSIISIEIVSETEIKVWGETRTFTYKVEKTEDYPRHPVLKPLQNFELETKVFEAQLKTLLPFVAKDEIRPVINAIWFYNYNDRAFLCASDAWLLGVIEQPVQLVSSFSISNPNLLLQMFGKKDSGSVIIEYDNKNHRIIFESMEYISRNIEGTPPAFLSVIPMNFNGSVTFSRADALEELELAAMFTDRVFNFEVSDDFITIIAKDQYKDKESKGLIYSQTEGEKVKSNFVVSQFVSFLKSIPEEKIKLEYVDYDRGFAVRGDSGTFLLMPDNR